MHFPCKGVVSLIDQRWISLSIMYDESWVSSIVASVSKYIFLSIRIKFYCHSRFDNLDRVCFVLFIIDDSVDIAERIINVP